VRDQTSAQIKAMGRFAEPALTHIAQISDDPEVQLRAAALLKQVLTTRGIRAGVTK
jgi:hypothetical protein